jgi:hypothetical protein
MALTQLGGALISAGCKVSFALKEENFSLFDDWILEFCGSSAVKVSIDTLSAAHQNDFYIIPETDISFLLGKIPPRSKTLLYLLSVDNIGIFGVSPSAVLTKNFLALKKIFKNKSVRRPHWRNYRDDISVILTQSRYADDAAIRCMGKPYFFIGDYTPIRKNDVGAMSQHPTIIGHSVVACTNGSKGRFFRWLVQIFNPGLKIEPIRGVPQNQIVSFIAKYDCYIDFGSLPGKDRLPREALLAGVPVFLFKRGAGINSSDYNLRGSYRFGFFDIFQLNSRVKRGIMEWSVFDRVTTRAQIESEKSEFENKVRHLCRAMERGLFG